MSGITVRRTSPLKIGAALGIAAIALLLAGSVSLLAGGTAGASPSSNSFGAAPSHSTAGEARAATAAVSEAPAAAPVLSDPGDIPSAISLSWSDTTTGTFENYTVQEASAGSGWHLRTVDTITAAATVDAVVSGVSPATDYDWQVAENYETCLIGDIDCTPGTATTNLLNVTQPPVAFLNYTGLTSSQVVLEWTNNATYGGLVSFDAYQLYRSTDGGAAHLIQTVTTESDLSYTDSITSGDSYTFYVLTEDCTAGCGGGSPTLSTTQSNLITLGPPLTLSVTVSAERSPIDLGQADFFTCTPSGGESPFEYAWEFGSGGYVAGNASESYTLNATGSQTVSCEITDAEPSTEAGSTDVYVNPALVVVASVNRSAADVGQSVGFTCYGEGGTTPYSLLWSFGDGMTSTVGNVSHEYLSADEFAATCAVSDAANGAEAPSFSLTASPALLAEVNASSTAAAPGTSLTFTAEPVNGSGSYTLFAWTFPGGTTASGRSVQHPFLGSGEERVSLQVTDSNGAKTDASSVVDVTPVGVAITAPSTATTTGSSLTFSASASGGAGGPYNYTWTFGQGSVGYGATVHHTYTATGSVTPTLVVTDRLGATNVTTLATIHVAAAPPPLAGIADWIILGIALLVAIVVGVIVLSRRRAAEASELEASAYYVPPTDPKKSIQGRKVCPSCGASNLPVRTTCSNCGKPLPRSSA
jgi:PKD domain